MVSSTISHDGGIGYAHSFQVRYDLDINGAIRSFDKIEDPIAGMKVLSNRIGSLGSVLEELSASCDHVGLIVENGIIYTTISTNRNPKEVVKYLFDREVPVRVIKGSCDDLSLKAIEDDLNSRNKTCMPNYQNGSKPKKGCLFLFIPHSISDVRQDMGWVVEKK